MRVGVASGALKGSHCLQRGRALVFLMTSGAGPILDDIWLVERVLLMAGFALRIE